MLTRIVRLGKLKPVSFDPDHDLEWSGTAKLRLCPHPGLTEEQSQAIQRDYDMREGVAVPATPSLPSAWDWQPARRV